MIRPGLDRIARLLSDTPFAWRAIHVAGTNGKGSVCNYVAAMLDCFNASKLRAQSGLHAISWAKFTSPHLIDRWDGIQTNGQTISKHSFEAIESRFQERDHIDRIDASEFELLTATAFEAFTAAKVDIGIVEVGMGGAEDATNLLGTDAGLETGSVQHYRPLPLVTAITKIGLDHQAFLGDTLSEIATHKAGIMKPGVPVAYDETNPREVVDVLRSIASRNGCPVVTLQDVDAAADELCGTKLPSVLADNYKVALKTVYAALDQNLEPGWKTHHSRAYEEFLSSCLDMATSIQIPGRLEWLSLTFKGRSKRVLIDGAHNAQAAARLVETVRKHRGQRPVTWLYGASQGRDVRASLELLLQPGDNIVAVEFAPIEGMPWVKPVPSADILQAAQQCLGDNTGQLVAYASDVAGALQAALDLVPENGLLVTTGSLYLVGDVHRALKNRQPPD